MPVAPPRACARGHVFAGSRCGQCVGSRKVYHQVNDAQRGSARERGYSKAWDRKRAYYATLHPLCEHCELQDVVRPGAEVDHIVPLDEGGALLDDANLQHLCKEHHARKTVEDKRRVRGRPGYGSPISGGNASGTARGVSRE